MARGASQEHADSVVNQYDGLAYKPEKSAGKRNDRSGAGFVSRHSTAFIVESIVVLLLTVVCMAVLFSVFGKSYQLSQQAGVLTRSITLATVGAENGAETFEANPDDPDCPELTMYVFEGESYKQVSSYVPGAYMVRRNVELDNTSAGVLHRATIEVSRYNETVYTLSTAKYVSNDVEGEAVTGDAETEN